MTTATRSPLRWPTRQKGSINVAACGRLRHLQAVATWAATQVPSLGAFLGSRLASTSQLLGSPPPPSSNFTCQRCESILQVGINCSVRVRSRKRKKRNSASKEVSPSINCTLYYCHYCDFENMKLGTSKGYVKTKISEMIARDKQSESNKGLEGKTTGEKTMTTPNRKFLSATKGLLTESACSSVKKTKRKGWLSLKQLAASSADLSPAGNRAASMRSSIFSMTPPRISTLDPPKLMPKLSLSDTKDVTPDSSIKEQCLLGLNLELEQCNMFTGNRTSNLKRDMATLGKQASIFTTNTYLSASPDQQQTGLSDVFAEALLRSRCDSICNIDAVSEKRSTNAINSFQKLGKATEVEKNEEPRSLYADANANVLDQLTDRVSQANIETLTAISSTQGVTTGKYASLTSNPISTLSSASVFNMMQDGAVLKPLQLPSKEEAILMSTKDVALNSTIVEPTRLISSFHYECNRLENKSSKGRQSLSKKRDLDNCDRSQMVSKLQKPMELGDLDVDGDTSKDKVISKFVRGKGVQSGVKPLFWRIGRHWFTKCRSRKIKWRVI